MRGWSQRKTLMLVLLGVLAIAALVSLSLMIDRAYIQKLALEQVERTLGPYITIGTVDFSLFPRPRLELTEVVVKERRDTHAFFRARSLSMELAVWPLFNRILEVNTLVIRQPEMEFRRDEAGRWRMIARGPSEESLAAGLFSVRHLVVETGHVTIIDETPREGVRGILIDEVSAEWRRNENARRPSFEMTLSGKVRSRDRAAVVAIAGRLDLSSSEAGSAQPSGSPRSLPVAFHGRVEAQDLVIAQILELVALDETFEEDLGRADIRSTVKVVPGTAGYDVSFLDLTFHNPLVSFTGAIHLSGLQTDEMTVSLVGNTAPIPLRQLKRHLPRGWMPDPARRVWQETEVDGTVEIVRMTVIGPTRSALGISVNGEVRVNDLMIHSSTGRWPALEHVNGTILLEPDRIRCRDFTGIYDDVPVEAAQAVILLKDSGPWLEMDVEGIVPARKVLAAFQDALGADDSAHPLSSWEAVQGEGRLSLRFAGAIRGTAHPFEQLALKAGTYEAQHLHLRLPRHGIVLSEIAGRLRFSPDAIAFEAVNGWAGPHPFRLDGTILTQTAPRFDDMTVLVKLEAGRLTAVGAPPWVDRFLPDGEIDGRLVVSGPLRAPSVKGEVDLANAALRGSPVLEKAQGVPSSLEFEGRVGTEGELIIEHVELSVLPVRVSGRGVVTVSPEWSFRARIDTGSIYVGLLPEGLSLADGVLRSGILEISLAVNGRGGDWRAWHTKGWIALTEGVMVAEGLDDALTHLFLRVKLDSRLAELTRLDFHIGESDVRIAGRIKNWKTHPNVAVVIESDRFDLDRLIPKGDRSPIRDALEVLAAEATVAARVSIAQPWYKRMQFRDLSTEVTMHDGLVKVDRLEARTEEDGRVGGRILVHLPRGKPAAVRVSFAVQDFPFIRVFESFGYERRLITGTVTAKGVIQGHGRHPQGVWRTLQGKAHVTLVAGRVRRGTILPRILAILNLPTLLREEVDWEEGFPFRKTQATLVIEKGIVTAEDIVIDSPIMKMTAVGSYDLAQDRLDGVVAVSPFGPYSDFLKSVPLFGKILTGERKGIATALFKVEGSLGDPVVTYLPLKSVATGLTGLAQLAIDILKNTLLLPTELLPNDREDASDRSTGRNAESTP